MSNTQRRRYIICYDIVDPRRLRRVAKICVQHATRLQYSVYETQLTASELRRLTEMLRQELDANKDDLRIYGMHESAVIDTIGTTPIMNDVHWTASAPHRSPSDSDRPKGLSNSLSRNDNSQGAAEA